MPDRNPRQGYPLDAHKYMLDHSSVKVDTALTYCHYSMNDTTLLDFLPYYKSKNVGVINASVGEKFFCWFL